MNMVLFCFFRIIKNWTNTSVVKKRCIIQLEILGHHIRSYNVATIQVIGKDNHIFHFLRLDRKTNDKTAKQCK